MGQAKSRGTFEQRKELALEKELTIEKELDSPISNSPVGHGRMTPRLTKGMLALELMALASIPPRRRRT